MGIAETILGVLLQIVFERLASREIVNFFRASKFDQSLLHKLKILMLASEKLLLDAEQKQMIDYDVREWLEELKHWFYRAEEVVDQIATEALRSSLDSESPSESQPFGTKVRNLFPDFSSSSEFHKTVVENIKEIIDMLKIMLNQKDALGLRELYVGGALRRVSTTCLLEDSEVYGRELEKEKILEYLISEEDEVNSFSVVAIVGMGGVGKTTLAKLVYNDRRLEEHFDLKAWVCISDQFDVSRVTRSIIESITHELWSGGFSDLNLLQMKLSSELRNKKFLLVLDDVWNEKYEEWEILRAPFYSSENGSKIIVTTRNKEVANIIRSKIVYSLQPLSHDDAWSLFSRHAFELGNLKSYACLEHIGRKIVHKCGGLPLAIKTLGGLLHCTHDSKDWEDILHSSMWGLPYNLSNVIPALWLSYYHLPGHLKCCFSYCALFPKDYKIDRKQLVLLWMAQNFVISTNIERIEDVGDKYVSQLISRSFLQPVDESYVTMHDLMHDLAQGVFGSFLARQEADCTPKMHKRTRHFSYVADLYDTINKFQAIKEFKFLRTFLQLHAKSFMHLTGELPTLLKPSLCSLRVLSLSGYQNLKLPQLIDCPNQLRYLDISHTTIKLLPEWVTTLCNLQTLVLSYCRCLESLPASMWRLVSLRHLDIRGATSLSQMPEQMSKLKSLRTLTDFIVGKNSGSSIQELRELRQICGRFAIRRLQNVVSPTDAYLVNLRSKESIDDLELVFDSKDDDSEKDRNVLESLKPPSNVERLAIIDYAGTKFPKWLDSGCADYKKMASLCLRGCLYCLSLPPLGQLPSLKELKIEGMDLIVKVGHEFYGHGICGIFPALESLSFKNMKCWEVWSNVDAKGNAVCFPCLTKLSLLDCPNLKGNFPVHVPSLLELEIDRCEQVSRLLPRVPFHHVSKTATCSKTELTRTFDLSTITTLRLEGLVQLVSLPPELHSLSSLTHLQIGFCDNLKSLANIQLPLTVEFLSIEHCTALESLPSGMGFLTHLQKLSLSECWCLKWVTRKSLPTSLSIVSVSDCENWEFPIPTKRMQHYKSLEILSLRWCGKHFVSFPLGIFPNLRHLEIGNCMGLKKVYFPEGAVINNLTSLSWLSISSCPELEMIGKATGNGEVTVLPAPNLAFFNVWNCERVKPVLIEKEGEVLLPKLTNLTIGKSNKILSYVPLRRSLLGFTCLRSLKIRGEEVECFPSPDEGWGFLPTSLTSLYLVDCSKLRRLDGKSLHSLKHLQELSIIDCPKLESLPKDSLPPSLGELYMRGCPMVEAMCLPEKGQYWSYIYHIPQIWINNHYIKP